MASPPHQPLLSSLVVRPSDSGGGGGSDYEPGEVRRDAPPYSRSDRYSDDTGSSTFSFLRSVNFRVWTLIDFDLDLVSVISRLNRYCSIILCFLILICVFC